MKRFLLSSVLGLGLLSVAGARQTSQALFCSNCTNEITSVMQFIEETSQRAQVVSNGVQQLNQARQTYDAWTNVRDLPSFMHAAGTLGVENRTNINPYAMQGLLNGSGGGQGMLANLGSLYNGRVSQNTVSQVPNLNRWVGNQINQRLAAASGTQAMSTQIYAEIGAAQTRISMLSNRIANASPAQQQMLQSALSAEQNRLSALNGQLASIGVYSNATAQVHQAQAEQRIQGNIEAVIQEARARGVF